MFGWPNDGGGGTRAMLMTGATGNKPFSPPIKIFKPSPEFTKTRRRREMWQFSKQVFKKGDVSIFDIIHLVGFANRCDAKVVP